MDVKKNEIFYFSIKAVPASETIFVTPAMQLTIEENKKKEILNNTPL